MNLVTALAACFLASIPIGSAQADDLISHWQTVADLGWDDTNWSSIVSGLPVGIKSELIGKSNAYTGVKLINPGSGPIDFNLRAVSQKEMDHLDRDHFAIIGEVSYENVYPYGSSSASYLEMYCAYASPRGTKDDYPRTLADSGPMGRLDAWSDWREFWVPAIVPDGYKVYRINFNLHLAGQGTVSIRNLKLVQYPETSDAPKGSAPSPLSSATVITALTPPTSPVLDQAALTSAYLKAQEELVTMRKNKAGLLDGGLHEQHPRVVQLDDQIKIQQELLDTLQADLNRQKAVALNWHSFVLGVVSTGLSLLSVTGLIFVSRMWRRGRHEHELRRMASLDS